MRGLGSIPGQGAEILHAPNYGQVIPILWALHCLVPESVGISTAASIAHGELTAPQTTLLIFVVSALDKGDAS